MHEFSRKSLRVSSTLGEAHRGPSSKLDTGVFRGINSVDFCVHLLKGHFKQSTRMSTEVKKRGKQ